MGVTKQTIQAGNGVDFAKAGDTVTIHYTGWLLDESKPERKGDKFDSSVDRNEPFRTPIGAGRVIRGWEEGVPQMTLGEKALLEISPDYGYGARGFQPVIPPNSTLLFEVRLLGINNRMA